MSRNSLVGLVLGIAVFFLLASSLFVVNQTEQALVLRFGELQRVVVDPGLYVKAPLIDEVIRYEKRVLSLDPKANTVILKDNQPLQVDAFVRYRIKEPAVFYRRLRSVETAEQRLSQFMAAATANAFGQVELDDLLPIPSFAGELTGLAAPDPRSGGAPAELTALVNVPEAPADPAAEARRNKVMSDIFSHLAQQTEPLGLEIAGVRVRRTDMPEAAFASVFARMNSERSRIAEIFRAAGKQRKRATETRADSDRDRTLAVANREAAQLKASAEAEAAGIYAEAYGRDAEFYAFWRSMEAYRKGLGEGGETTLMLSPDDPFLRYLRRSSGLGASGPGASTPAAEPAAP